MGVDESVDSLALEEYDYYEEVKLKKWWTYITIKRIYCCLFYLPSIMALFPPPRILHHNNPLNYENTKYPYLLPTYSLTNDLCRPLIAIPIWKPEYNNLLLILVSQIQDPKNLDALGIIIPLYHLVQPERSNCSDELCSISFFSGSLSCSQSDGTTTQWLVDRISIRNPMDGI